MLAVVLVAAMRAEGKPRLARGLVLGLFVANPLTLLALEVGHPEELLGAALCLGAILLAAAGEASRRRALAAGVLLGLAIANKQWALLAAGPVLLALPAARRLACCAAALAVAALIEAPLLIARRRSYVHASTAAAAPASGVFQPWQVWWFLGHHGRARARPVRRGEARLPDGPGLDEHAQPPARARRRARRPRPRCGCGGAPRA